MHNLKKYMTNRTGYFGEFGGRYVPELIEPILHEVEKNFYKLIEDAEFQNELTYHYRTFSGRPTPLTYLSNLTSQLGGAKIYLKNEGLNHTGAHKINHCIGQALIAKRMGKKRIIAETGAGQHGLATAACCARLGLSCTIYMGEKDYLRQRPNVFLMETMGAKVVPVTTGGKGLREAITSAMQDLISNPLDTFYLLGTACGPHPYPAMNAYFQSIISREIKEQIQPDYIVACLGGGSNSMGAFFEFLDDNHVKLVAVEAGGKSLCENNFECCHAARFETGSVGVAQGFKSMMLQNADGQLKDTHSISAGLDYAAVGPQIAYLHKIKRVKVVSASDEEVLEALNILAKTEGIIGALESLHAVAYALKLAPTLGRDKTVVINLSGRGDKDIFITAPRLDGEKFNDYLKSLII